MKIFYVYILLCADASYYVGITSDLERRIGEHQYGHYPGCYTFKRRPLQCVPSSDFANFDDAVRWEKQLKGWSRGKKRAFIEGRMGDVKMLAKRPSRPSRPSRLAALAPQDDAER